MLKAIANLFRLLLIARTLARHDALFPLERLGVAPGVMTLVRLISRQQAPGRPGERLAAVWSEHVGSGDHDLVLREQGPGGWGPPELLATGSGNAWNRCCCGAGRRSLRPDHP